jgi:flagellar hook-length control protein FliK
LDAEDPASAAEPRPNPSNAASPHGRTNAGQGTATASLAASDRAPAAAGRHSDGPIETAAALNPPTNPVPPPPSSVHAAPSETAALAPPPPQAAPPGPQSPNPQTSPPAVPAAQLGAAFVLAAAPRTGGAQPLLIRLAPVELGHVQVSIERPADAPARVVLAVERPDTLMLLMRDQPQLNRALDAAGVPPEGRTLQFNLGNPDPGQSNGGGGPGAGPNGGSGQFGGFAGNGGRHQDMPRQPPPPRGGWLRAGVDITA